MGRPGPEGPLPGLHPAALPPCVPAGPRGKGSRWSLLERTTSPIRGGPASWCCRLQGLGSPFMNLGRVTFAHVTCLLRGPHVLPTDYVLLALTSSAPPPPDPPWESVFLLFQEPPPTFLPLHLSMLPATVWNIVPSLSLTSYCRSLC